MGECLIFLFVQATRKSAKGASEMRQDIADERLRFHTQRRGQTLSGSSD